MADQKTCDRCDQAGAFTTAVSIAIAGGAVPGQAIAHTAQADACASCRPAVSGILHAHALAMLAEQIPFHKAIADKNAELSTAQADFEALRPTLEAHDTDGTELPAELAAQRDEILGRMEAAESGRLEAVQQGTAVSDQRQATLPELLRA